MSLDTSVIAPSVEGARYTPVRRDGHDFRRYYFPGFRAHLLVGPRLVSQPNTTGNDWELTAEAPGSLAEITNMSVVEAPHHTGLNLYRAAIAGLSEMPYTHLSARVHNARVIKIMQRVHGSGMLLLPKDLRNNADAKRHHCVDKALAGKYGDGISPEEGLTFLTEGAPVDGYMSTRCVDVFIDMSKGVSDE